MGYAGRDSNANKQSWAARQKRGELPKGVPVPGLRKKVGKCPCCSNSRAGRATGVSANERLLSHRYKCEGDKGAEYRRLLRRVGGRFWLRDQFSEGDWSRRF